MKLTFNTIAKEICKREKSEHREVNITDVSRVMKHFLDILAETEVVHWDNIMDPKVQDSKHTPLAAFFNRYIPRRMKKIRDARIPNPKRTVTKYSKSQSKRKGR